MHVHVGGYDRMDIHTDSCEDAEVYETYFSFQLTFLKLVVFILWAFKIRFSPADHYHMTYQILLPYASF